MANYVKPVAGCIVACGLLMAGCSGPTEDVRVTFCKNLARSLHPSAQTIEWTGGENTFRRPEYAITALRFDLVDGSGRQGGQQAACHYAYEALDDTALNLAYPFDAYATLPFAMSLNGRMLSDAELLKAVNAEQRRQGRQVLDTLQKGARDMADRLRAGVGQ